MDSWNCQTSVVQHRTVPEPKGATDQTSWDIHMDERIIRLSVQDVVRSLETDPVQADLVPEFTIMQVVNRAPTAHLSIERVLKFLIRKAGGYAKENHQLHTHLRMLRQHDPGSAAFLDRAFADATRFYGFNPNVPDLKHLESLDSYLSMVGTAHAFDKFRYWESDQPKDDPVIARFCLELHLEILHALWELLAPGEHPRRTIQNRVEEAVQEAMLANKAVRSGYGTSRAASVKAYIAWVRQHDTCQTALKEAIQRRFSIGDQYMSDAVREAFETLAKSQDPAVRYLTVRLDVLPRQPRDVTPPVEWRDPKTERHGIVKTPGGSFLRLIDRSADGVWNITPARNGLVSASARTDTQTDARCYLAQLLTVPATVTAAGKQTSSRLVAEKYAPFRRNYEQSQGGSAGDPFQWSHQFVIWSDVHGIKVHDHVKIEVQDSEFPETIHTLEGHVTNVDGSGIYIVGSDGVETAKR